MATITTARVIRSEQQAPKPRVAPDVSASNLEQVKIVLQPRLCTLRSYAADRGNGVIKSIVRTKEGGEVSVEGEEVMMSPFYANLYEYIESSKKSHDFEIITGRLAMIVFAATIGVELATGNSVFKKMDVQGLTEGLGACLAAVGCAAGFAYSSSARKKVGKIFTLSCNAFIDTLIDNIVDGLFYESDLDDDDDDANSSGKDL